jgi:hypothetical protein
LRQDVQLDAAHQNMVDNATLSVIILMRQARRLARNLVAKSAAVIHPLVDDSPA